MKVHHTPRLQKHVGCSVGSLWGMLTHFLPRWSVFSGGEPHVSFIRKGCYHKQQLGLWPVFLKAGHGEVGLAPQEGFWTSGVSTLLTWADNIPLLRCAADVLYADVKSWVHNWESYCTDIDCSIFLFCLYSLVKVKTSTSFRSAATAASLNRFICFKENTSLITNFVTSTNRFPIFYVCKCVFWSSYCSLKTCQRLPLWKDFKHS